VNAFFDQGIKGIAVGWGEADFDAAEVIGTSERFRGRQLRSGGVRGKMFLCINSFKKKKLFVATVALSINEYVT
jgi:hypothetical protein